MLHQTSETSSTLESTRSFGYTEHAKQWAKGGALLFGLGALGALGYRFLGWVSSNLHSAPLGDLPIKAPATCQQHASIEELDADGNSVLQTAVSYSHDTNDQVSVTYPIDRTIVNPLATASAISSYLTNKTLIAHPAISTAGASVADFKSVAANELYLEDDLILEYRESGLTVNSEDGDTNIVSVKDERASHISCSNALIFGLMGSLLTRNPLYLGVASVFCVQEAYGQTIDMVANGEVQDQILHTGQLFEGVVNMTELFDGPIKDTKVTQSKGASLPSWLSAEEKYYLKLKSEVNIKDSGNQVSVNGNFAYVASDNGLEIIDISDLQNPQQVGNITGFSAYEVIISGNLAYVAAGDTLEFVGLFGGLRILNISNPINPVQIGNLTSISALGIAVNNTVVYIAGQKDGLIICNVSNPNIPTIVRQIKKNQHTDKSIYNAEKVAFDGNFVYVADSGESIGLNGGLKIIDVNNATDPIISSIASFTQIESGGIVIINPREAKGVTIKGDFAYVVYDDSVQGGLQIVDITDVKWPKEIKFIEQNIKGVAFANNLIYIVNYSDLKVFTPVFSCSDIVVESSYSGLSSGTNVAVVHGNNQIYVIDNNVLKIIDNSGVFLSIKGVPPSILKQTKVNLILSATDSYEVKREKTFSFFIGSEPKIIGNIKDQSITIQKSNNISLDLDNLFEDSGTLSLGIQVNGNYTLPGFIKLNNNPSLVGLFSTKSATNVELDSAGDIAYVADGDGGLKIIDVKNPIIPVQIGEATTAEATRVKIDENMAYVVSKDGSIKIFNVSEPTNPIILSNITDITAVDVAVNSDLLYVANGCGCDFLEDYGGVIIFNISDIRQPALKPREWYDISGYAQKVVFNKNFAYVAYSGCRDCFNEYVEIYDISNNIYKHINSYELKDYYGQVLDVAIAGSLAYIAKGDFGLEILDVSDVYNPYKLGQTKPGDIVNAQAVVISGTLAYVADNGLSIVDIRNPANPIKIGHLPTNNAFSLSVSNNLVYLAAGCEGLKIIDVTNYQITAQPLLQNDEGNYDVVVIATDSIGLSANITFKLRVEGQPKLMQPIQSQIALIGESFYFFIPQGTFWDPNNDLISYNASLSDRSALPVFLSFNPNSATFWGTPEDQDIGTYNITIFATDRITDPTPASFSLLVHHVPFQDKPVSNQVAEIGKQFAYTFPSDIFKSKDDSYNFTYTAMKSNLESLPYWLNFNNQTLTFNGIPSEVDKGSLELAIMVNDGKLGKASANFRLVIEHFPYLVRKINTIYAAINHYFEFGGSSYFNYSGDYVLQYSANYFDSNFKPAEWLIFDKYNCKFYGTPKNSGGGNDLKLELHATDSAGGSVVAQFNLIVNDYKSIVNINNATGIAISNSPFILVDTLVQGNAVAGKFFSYSPLSAFFHDPENDALTFTFVSELDKGGANWLELTPDGRLKGTPDYTDAYTYRTRTYTINITASDPANVRASSSLNIVLEGPSATEKGLNAFFSIAGAAVAGLGYLQKKYLLWNWLKKKNYKKPEFQIAVGQTGVFYQINFPSDKIKSIVVTTLRDGRFVKRHGRCLDMFKNGDENTFQGRVKFYVFDWLLYDPKINQFQVIENGPGESFLQQDIIVQVTGSDNRIMEQFNIIVANKLEESLSPSIELSNASSAIANSEVQLAVSNLASLQALTSASTSAVTQAQTPELHEAKETQNIEEKVSGQADIDQNSGTNLRGVATQAQLLTTVGFLNSKHDATATELSSRSARASMFLPARPLPPVPPRPNAKSVSTISFTDSASYSASSVSIIPPPPPPRPVSNGSIAFGISASGGSSS